MVRKSERHTHHVIINIGALASNTLEEGGGVLTYEISVNHDPNWIIRRPWGAEGCVWASDSFLEWVDEVVLGRGFTCANVVRTIARERWVHTCGVNTQNP